MTNAEPRPSWQRTARAPRGISTSPSSAATSKVELLRADHDGKAGADLPLESLRLTKVWSQKDFPLIDVGELELNRNPENYYAEVEQAAFSRPTSCPESFSPDKMLQARIFSYADAHRYRVGTHYEMLPVNRPKFPTHNYHMTARCVSTRRSRPTPITSRTASAVRRRTRA